MSFATGPFWTKNRSDTKMRITGHQAQYSVDAITPDSWVPAGFGAVMPSHRMAGPIADRVLSVAAYQSVPLRIQARALDRGLGLRLMCP